ncbi:aldo/keto reductase [Mrakia frigida]|uniref:aldo/keto reductase n=1 Tax=Mrakia frigida TaxID=29902 RepID=UPI003FCBF4A3
MASLSVAFKGENLSPLGFGAMGLSEFYGSGDEEEKLATLKLFIAEGGSPNQKCVIDTADCYGPYTNEILVGPFVQQNRDRVFLATKFSILRGPGGSWDGVRGDPEYVKEACEKSLERLGVDYIDLYYQHRVDPKTPIEETVRALKELQDAGKIRHIGLSECSADTLRRASKVAKIAAVQWEYSLFTTDIETNGVLDACKELGIALVAYSPLGRGMIGCDWKTESEIPVDDYRKYLPRFKGEAFVANMKLVTSLRELASKKGISANQLALKWVIDQEALPIPGTKRTKYLKDNLGSVNVEISKEEHAEIRKLLDTIEVEGQRYDESQMASVNA